MADRHSERRVAVTGMGMVSAVGHDVPSNWDALLAGTPGGSTITECTAPWGMPRDAGESKGGRLPGIT